MILVLAYRYQAIWKAKQVEGGTLLTEYAYELRPYNIRKIMHTFNFLKKIF